MEILFVVLIGLCFGSYISMASYRLPRGLSTLTKRSFCPECEKNLTVRQLAPVFSWLFSGGRCGHCKAKVSVRYPLTEVLTAGVFLLLYHHYGFTVQTGFLALFSVALLVMLVADLETKLIPDEIHFFLIPLGVAYHWYLGRDWSSLITCALFAGFIGVLLHYGYYYLRGRHGLGFGDVKFLFVAGIWLGNIHIFPAYIFYSGVLGVATGLVWRLVHDDPRFPFAPALAIALFAVTVFPQTANFFTIAMEQFLRP